MRYLKTRNYVKGGKIILEISDEMSEQCVPCDRDCQECRETHVFTICAGGS